MKAFAAILLLVLMSPGPSLAQGVVGAQFGGNMTSQWTVLEWSLDNPSYSGNPYDLIANVTFTHESGHRMVSEMFYAGGNTWKFRFTPTATGNWNFHTSSSDSDLNGRSGSVSVTAPERGQTGFLVAQGDKWVWQGKGAVVPHYVMAGDTAGAFENPAHVDNIINTFVRGHGFDGLHVAMFCSWFWHRNERCDGLNSETNPDRRAFEILEMVLFKARAAGALVHIWQWGDDGSARNPSRFVGLNSTADRRLQRYIAARLGAIPNWSMGYGYDVFEWAKESDLNSWLDYVKARLPYPHLFGARADTNQLNQLSERMDYGSYEQWKPSYNVYLATIAKRPHKPSFSEDRFRVNQKNGFAYKDYTFDETRRGFWHSALSGGVPGIWGNLNGQIVGLSFPYPEETRQQLLTYRKFWDPRFKVESRVCNDLVPGSSNNYPKLGSRDERGAAQEAAEWVFHHYPEFFRPGTTRAQAYNMMTIVINVLRSNGWDARRTLANASRPPTDPYRWGSDAVAMGGPQKNIYDIYTSWPHPATPNAVHHGNQEGELTSDLIPLNSQGDKDPKTGVCLKSDDDHLVFYREGAASVSFDLRRMSRAQRVVAVDTRRPYDEFVIGRLNPGVHTWQAPYNSDWAISVGDFGSFSGDWAENTARLLYRGLLNREADEGGLKGWARYMKSNDLNGVVEIVRSFAQSQEFKDRLAGLAPEQIVTKMYRSLFKRDPDASGMATYTQMISEGKTEEVLIGLVNSDEYITHIQYVNYPEKGVDFCVNLINQLYREALMRGTDADFPGANGVLDLLRSKVLIPTRLAAQKMAESDEFKSNIAGQTPEAILKRMYNVFFDREPDDHGLNTLVPLIQSGRITDVVEVLVGSQEFKDRVFNTNGKP